MIVITAPTSTIGKKVLSRLLNSHADIRVIARGPNGIEPADKVDGFQIQFTHRGSWKADLLAPGKEVEVIPVTWTKDWVRNDGTVFVWLKKTEEVAEYSALTSGFKIAIARQEGGSASSNNIIGIFWVTPIKPSDDPRGVLCKMEKRLKPADV